MFLEDKYNVEITFKSWLIEEELVEEGVREFFNKQSDQFKQLVKKIASRSVNLGRFLLVCGNNFDGVVQNLPEALRRVMQDKELRSIATNQSLILAIQKLSKFSGNPEKIKEGILELIETANNPNVSDAAFEEQAMRSEAVAVLKYIGNFLHLNKAVKQIPDIAVKNFANAYEDIRVKGLRNGFASLGIAFIKLLHLIATTGITTGMAGKILFLAGATEAGVIVSGASCFIWGLIFLMRKISKINNSKIISDIVATILYMVEPGAINDKDQSSEEF